MKEDGDEIIVRSGIGAITTRAQVTEGIHPRAIAIAHHCGHWAHGVYASGKKTPAHVYETDCDNKWWNNNGSHVNLIIPNVGDPISGSLCWMDTIVKVKKA
jgi:anaerobic selenocysteine-containing dehydrogenase